MRSAELLNKEELQRCQKQLEYQLLGLSLCFDSSILLFCLSQDRLNFKERWQAKVTAVLVEMADQSFGASFGS